MGIGYVEFVLILLEIVDKYNVVSPGYVPIETSQDLYMLFGIKRRIENERRT